MSNRALSKEEVERRLIRLRNLEALYEAQRFKIWHLRDENRELKKEVARLTSVVQAQGETINDLKLQIEELRTIVFGKQRNHDYGRHDDVPPPQATPPIERTRESYQRKIPREHEITEIKHHPVSRCVSCGGKLHRRNHASYFEEDIPLPHKKIVVRHTIEKGYCDTCETWSAGAPLPSSPVILGTNVKRYIAYLSIVCRQSYSQTQDMLKHTYDFNISQGEIANIMEREGERLRPSYERLKAKIRGEPSVHLDETSWHLLTHGDRSYAWTMTGGISSDTVFALGKTRGKGNADDLIGDSEAVVVSDDYGAYRNMKNPHQLCWAHILRKLRNLATSEEMNDAVHVHCVHAHETFASIYAHIEQARQSSDPGSAHDALLARLTAFAIPHRLDPAKLSRVKLQIGARTENYLTCLVYPNVASDNNAAERSLRHLVLKRKISFGSFSLRTAETTAILLSVLMSWKRRGELRGYLMGA